MSYTAEQVRESRRQYLSRPDIDERLSLIGRHLEAYAAMLEAQGGKPQGAKTMNQETEDKERRLGLAQHKQEAEFQIAEIISELEQCQDVAVENVDIHQVDMRTMEEGPNYMNRIVLDVHGVKRKWVVG